MNKHKILSLAYSSCPNDTFIFHALAHKLINTSDLDFNISLADVETLNQNAEKSIFDITKLSFAAFGNLRNRYALLKTGAALGRGCGPLVISLGKRKPDDMKIPKIAVPGLGTTAYLLFRLLLDDFYPGLNPEILHMGFEKIMPSVKSGKTDFGVIIHEGRFVYTRLGLECLADLGKWWEGKTSLPIPLGCIAVKRDMDRQKVLKIQSLIKDSIDYAFNNPSAGKPYIKMHAKELDDKVIDEHIRLYVNEFSKDIGEQGEKAIKVFLEKGEKAGLIVPDTSPLFA